MACSLRSTCWIEDVVAVRKYLFGGDSVSEDNATEEEEVTAWSEESWADEWDGQSNNTPAKDAGAQAESKGDWLNKCYLAFSPTYDLLVVARGQKMVLLTVKSDSFSHSHGDGSRCYRISNQIEVGDEAGELVTSILCIPLVSLKKSSHGNVDWSCIVVGFSSGYIKIYTESGDQLISQLLHESSVIEIRCRTQDPMAVRRSVSIMDQPDEVTILYGDAIILLEGFSLYQTLRACRSQVALAAASGGMSIEPPPLSYKKWRLTGNQIAISSHISPGILTPNPFDQMRTASILGGFHAEIRGSAPAMSCFVATGSSPYIGFYYAIEGDGISHALTATPFDVPQKHQVFNRGKRTMSDSDLDSGVAQKRRRLDKTNGSAQLHLSHVALAVASKLKSALYNSASRWLSWGSGSQQQPEQKPAPKVELGSPLDIRCGMPDPLRHGDNIVLAPGAHLSSSALAATTDSLGRVILMDVSRAVALRMWKGYRDAQVGFMRVYDDAHRSHRHHEHDEKRFRRHALFLLIYAPRRGLLEVWTCINGPRVGAFNVGKNARLLCPGFGMLGINTSTMSGSTCSSFQCCLVEGNGQVKEIKIPFHLALSDANSKKARDMHLLKKLSLILHSRKRTGEEASKILLEIRISGMLRQALEKLLHTRKLGTNTFRSCLMTIQSRLKEGGALKKPDNDLLKYCEVQLSLITLYESIQKINENAVSSENDASSDLENVTNVDSLSKLLHMTTTEVQEALSAISRLLSSQQMPKVSFEEEERPSLDCAEFLDCFSVAEAPEKDWRALLKVPDERKAVKLGSYFFYSSIFKSASAEDIFFTLSNALELEPRAILDLVVKYWLSQDITTADSLAGCLQKLYNYVESCCKKAAYVTSESTVPDENSTDELQHLWKWIREDVCATSDNSVATFCLALVARAIVIAHNTQDTKEEKEDSDADDWEKMQTQETEEESSPPSYQESCDDGNKKCRSGEWETLWIDVEKWNLFVHQLQDSMLINTAISYGRSKKPKSDEKTALTGLTSKAVTVKDLLTNGPGFMAELVSHPICLLRIPALCVQKSGPAEGTKRHDELSEQQQKFLEFLNDILYPKFPYSLAPDCLHSHCFWELVVEWNKDPMDITLLVMAIDHLKLVCADAQARHGLALIAWKTFIFKRFNALAQLVERVGKAPKDRLCRKEVGISSILMPQFCQVCTDILQIIADADVDHTPRATNLAPVLMPPEAEDPWLNVTGRRSIMDIGRAHTHASVSLLQHNMHLSFILHATMQFLLRGVKPLSSLFDEKGRACFLIDLTTQDASLPDQTSLPTNVIKARQQFLGKVVSSSVQQLAICLQSEEKADASDSLSKQDLENWIETGVHMAVEFGVPVEKMKMRHVEELFKNGLDSMGTEACTAVTDKEVLSSALALIVGQRLSYILMHANPEDGVIMISRMSPTLSTWIKSQDSSVLKKPDVPISDTLLLTRNVLSMMSESHSLYNIVCSLEETALNMSRSATGARGRTPLHALEWLPSKLKTDFDCRNWLYLISAFFLMGRRDGAPRRILPAAL